MVLMNFMIFYTYLWLRENWIPYYAGKGTGDRAFSTGNHYVACPKDLSRILIQYWPDEDTAFAYERYLIDFYGRKDLGTGCLRNLTDGGEGCIHTEEWKQDAAVRMVGNKHALGAKHTEEMNAAKGLRNTGQNNPFFGKSYSVEALGKIAVASKRAHATAKKTDPAAYSARQSKPSLIRWSKKSTEQRKAELAFVLHSRWHVKRGISKPECACCAAVLIANELLNPQVAA